VHNAQSSNASSTSQGGKCKYVIVICRKKQKQCLSDELAVGDCLINVGLAHSSGLILAAWVEKHTDAWLEEFSG
jgi:hypothetical protein